MPTATETQMETEQVPVTFIARGPDQVLTVKSPPIVDNGFGGKKVLTFDEYLERQAEKNEERELNDLPPRPIDDMPWKVEFKANSFTTDHPKLIAWLRQHKTFQTNGPSGFYEEAPAPEDPATALTDPVKLITQASINRDRVQLEAIREVEQERDNPRPTIIEAVETALEMIDEETPKPGADAENPPNGDSTSTSPPSPAA